MQTLSGGRVEVTELSVAAGSRADRKPLHALKLPQDTLVLSVSRGDEDIVPGGDFTFRDGDHIIVIAQRESIAKIQSLFSR
jgi:trk system potassium uptake protein TrkA